jgi:hypothetical protein
MDGVPSYKDTVHQSWSGQYEEVGDYYLHLLCPFDGRYRLILQVPGVSWIEP